MQNQSGTSDFTTKQPSVDTIRGLLIEQDEGTIRQTSDVIPRDRMQMAVIETKINAVTHYQVLERLGIMVNRRTRNRAYHSIGNMKHIGHTLFNDERYGGHEILKRNSFQPNTNNL